jgi:hypothetical protein
MILQKDEFSSTRRPRAAAGTCPAGDEPYKDPGNGCEHCKQNLNLLYGQEEHARNKRAGNPYENDGEGADHPLPYSVRYLLGRSMHLPDDFFSFFGRKRLQRRGSDFLLGIDVVGAESL